MANSNAESRTEFAVEEKPEARKQRLWVAEIENSKKVYQDWHDQCDHIVKRYRDERHERSQGENSRQSRRYNALWSIVKTLQPNLFTRLPPPFLNRTFTDKDPAGRDASLILERTIAADLEGNALQDAVKEARDDLILCGRGVPWMKYGAEFALRDCEDLVEVEDEQELPEGTEVEEVDGKRMYRPQVEYKASEHIDWEHVHYRSFLHGPASKWRHVPWVARLVPMLKDELVKRFGKKIAEEIPLTMSDRPKKSKSDSSEDERGLFARAEIWEVWDRTTRTVIWVCPDYKDSVLDEKKDILGLPGFYPCPKPAFDTMTNDRLDPVPSYIEWQDIAIELDEVTLRIKLLTQALAVKGAYNAELGNTMSELISSGENKLIAVDNWAMFAEAGGFKGAIDWLPIEQISATLDKLVTLRSQLIKELYEITGVGDIIRGSSDPRDTATAQQIKGQYASQRLKTQQTELARMVVECYVLMGELIAKHYDDETIMAKSAAQQILVDENGEFDMVRWQNAIALIRDDDMRKFRIDVNNETMGGDDFQKQGQEVQIFTQSVGSLIAQAMPLVQQAPALADVTKGIIMLGMRQFRVGRSLEATMERALDNLIEQAKNMKPDEPAPTGKSPEELEIMRDQVRVDRERVGVERQRLLAEEARDKRAHQLAMAKLRTESTIDGTKIQSAERQTDKKLTVEREKIGVQAQAAARADTLKARDQTHRAQVDTRKQAVDEHLRSRAQQFEEHVGMRDRDHAESMDLRRQSHDEVSSDRQMSHAEDMDYRDFEAAEAE